jgi:hypothetical protein
MNVEAIVRIAVVTSIGLFLHILGVVPLPVWKDGRLRGLWWCTTGQHYHLVPHPDQDEDDSEGDTR